ncbi:hypothetical protein C802_01561 [Phocaeicola sartorii]|jgi:hypothetical protein|uniref:Uncharacterized protein n=1 Tax=Phocaeicola sartorii TaxID=671267 RepID=R9I9W7_9BACT|nr:hypothetical protein C802_01561 [Phocaeicola sartorii]
MTTDTLNLLIQTILPNASFPFPEHELRSEVTGKKQTHQEISKADARKCEGEFVALQKLGS